MSFQNLIACSGLHRPDSDIAVTRRPEVTSGWLRPKATSGWLRPKAKPAFGACSRSESTSSTTKCPTGISTERCRSKTSSRCPEGRGRRLLSECPPAEGISSGGTKSWSRRDLLANQPTASPEGPACTCSWSPESSAR